MEAAEAAPAPQGKERVLVVDDEPALAMVTKHMLEHLGYEVDYRTSAMDALRTLSDGHLKSAFDLVITDMTMPHLTGADLAQKVHLLQPGLPVILCTVFS